MRGRRYPGRAPRPTGRLRAVAPVLEYLLAVRRYSVAFVTGSLPIAAYTVLAVGWPDTPQKQYFWNHIPQWAVIILALLGVTAAQYLAWRDLRAVNETLRRELRERALYNRRVAIAAELDMRFGSTSNLSNGRRFDLAKAHLAVLEAEVLAGDFTNAEEVLILKDIMLPVLMGWFGGGAGYQMEHERLFKVVDAVSRHERELAAKES